jgi:hypothetical protein
MTRFTSLVILGLVTLGLAACGGGGGGDDGDDGDDTPPACTPDNCDGCCAGDECRPGTATSACGAAGFGCEACDADETCDDGSCVAACGPANCAGCCDATGACVGGDAPGACGSGGEACAACGGGEECSGGACISAACATTCNGCCNGDNCVDGDADTACGLGGIACVACGAGRTCGPGGTCDVDPAAPWNVVAVNADVQVLNAGGSPWDPFGGLPDPYVELTAGGAAAPAASGTSPSIDNSVTPSWDDAIVVAGATAPTLREDLTIRLLDSDFDAADEICVYAPALPDAAFGGALIEMTCPSGTLRLRIVAP